MERNPLHDLTKDELIALILEMREQTAEQCRRIEEFEKRNPTPRLDEAYSMKAEEKRQADAEQGEKSKRKKQKSKRRGRISTAEKLAKATMQEDIWLAPHRLEDCRLRYSRPVWRIINGRAVLLNKDEFKGILVSDDAAVYQGSNRAEMLGSSDSQSDSPDTAETESQPISPFFGRTVGDLSPGQSDRGRQWQERSPLCMLRSLLPPPVTISGCCRRCRSKQ